MAIAGVGNTARKRPHPMERTSSERGETSIGNQPRGRLPMATSIFTEHAVRSVHDGDVIKVVAEMMTEI